MALLERMGANGQVDEVDASKVRVGQRVGLRLEANPDVEHIGVVTRIAALVGNESPESRIKVAHLEIKMEKTDPSMRPGMRVRGLIQVDRIPAVLQLPIAALRIGSQGPEVLRVSRWTDGGGAGASSAGAAATPSRWLSGLQPGDRVAIRGGPASPPESAGGLTAAGGSR